MNAKKLTVVLFFILLLIPMLYLILSFHTLQSSSSDGMLPEVGIKSVFDKSYATDFERYFSQQFINRDQLLELKTKMDMASGKQESNNVYITNTMLLEKTTLPLDSMINNIVSSVNQFVTDTGKQTYFMITPSSSEIYKELLLPYTPTVDELGFINQTYSKLHSKIVSLDTVKPLTSVKTEKIYYNTDRRLTSFGAYSIYNYNAKLMGFVSAKLNDFNIEYVTQDIYGSLHQKTQYAEIPPDVIELYHYTDPNFSTVVNVKNGTETTYNDGMYFKDKLTSSDPLGVFLSGIRPYIHVTTSNKSGKNLLVFADGNIGTMTQFLSLHYDSITIVNLSYMTDYYKDTIHINDYNNVLFMYGINSLSDSEKFTRLSMFAK